MAYNLTTLRSTVQSRIRDASFSSALLTQFANDTQRQIFNDKMLRFMETSADVTTTLGSQALTGLPSDIQIVLDLRITAPKSYAAVLTYMPPEDFDKFYPQPTLWGNGVPFVWYDPAGTVTIFPQADNAGGTNTYTLTMRYLKTPVELSADADVPSVPSEFQELMILGMMVRALEQKENFDQAFFYGQQFDQLLTDFTARYGARQGFPIIIPLNGR